MADTPIPEVLENLHEIEKDSYKELIDIAIKNAKTPSTKFEIMTSFMTDRINRLEALSEAFDEKYQSSDITDNYVVFRGILSSISGQNEELDQLNGLISQIVFGDIRAQRLRKREVVVLNERNSIVVNEIIAGFEEFKENAEELKNNIPEESSEA